MSTGRYDQRIVEEAATWSACMMEPESEAEVAAFEAWLARDPSHPRAYAEIEAVRTAVGSVALDHRPERSVRTITGSRGYHQRLHAWGLLWRPAFAAALVVLAFATIAVLWQGASSPAYAAITNPGPAVRGVRLADSSVVWLDIDEAIGVRLTSKRRELSVQKGRIRMVPAPDSRPLEVLAGAIRIAPNAGRFDVTRVGEKVTVTALDGPLELQRIGREGATLAVIDQGDAVAFDAAGTHAAFPDRDWPAGRLQFNKAPLQRIVELANRQPGPDIALEDGEIGELRITGVFDLRDTRRLARKLSATLGLRLTEDGQSLFLRR